jgi:hypothetical protein
MLIIHILRYSVVGFILAMMALFAILAIRHRSVSFTTKTVRVLSVIGLIVHSIFLGFCVMLGRLSDGPPPDLLATLATPTIWLPFIYFALCFVSTFPRCRGLGLVFCGIAAHLVVLPFCFYMIRNGAGVFAILPFILAPFWFLMSVLKMKVSDA